MKTIIVVVMSILLLMVMPWGTKEANDNSLFHPVQVMVWEVFGSHPDAFYAWRDR